MQWYAALIVIAAMVISGCASQGGDTGKRSTPVTETDAVANPPDAGTVPGLPSEPAVAGPAAERAAAAPSNAPAGGVTPKRAPGTLARTKNRSANAAVLGAVGGGLSNGSVGAYMESQKQDLQKALHDEIRSGSARVDKLPHNVVRIRMPTRTAFEINSSSIKPGFFSTMDKVADVVIRYGKTMLTVVGRSDSGGPVEGKRSVSQRRARSVVQYLESKDVNPVRLATLRKGESDPITGNGRDSNLQDRIEIFVEPVVAK
jgi:outer membrane protein OmpA-like peptidoglycan-associated protein